MRIHFYHREEMVIDCWHFAARNGAVLRIMGSNIIIDAEALREDPDSKIITDDPEAVCKALGLHYPDKQVTER